MSLRADHIRADIEAAREEIFNPPAHTVGNSLYVVQEMARISRLVIRIQALDAELKRLEERGEA